MPLLDGHGEVVRLGRPRPLLEGKFDTAPGPGLALALGQGLSQEQGQELGGDLSSPGISLPRSLSLESWASGRGLATSEKSAEDSVSADADEDEVGR